MEQTSIHKLGHLTTSLWEYGFYIVLAALLIRVLLCVFKAWAGKSGEHGVLPRSRDWDKLFLSYMYGFSGNEYDDNWVAFFLGLLELIICPFLLNGDRVDIIGAWLVFKTVPSWKTWGAKRNSYNRFLLFSLMSISISYYFMWLWIE